MKKKRFSRTAMLLLILGALLQLGAFLALQTGGSLLEYAICAPDVREIEASTSSDEAGKTRRDTGLEPLMKAREEVQKQLGDSLAALACGGMKSGTSISGGGANASATLQAV